MEGRLVTRYGTAARGAPSYIGARRSATDPTEILWDGELVVALTADEVGRHRREYEREVEGGNLRRRTGAEYEAQLAREAPTPPPAAAAAVAQTIPTVDPAPTAPTTAEPGPAPAVEPPPTPEK